jgi:branched-subunit amino acid ABC-type transport system permease component
LSILPQITINSIIAGATYALIALGFNFIYGATKFFNLAHGAVATVGGYVVFFILHTLGWNLYLAVIIGVISAGVLGYGLDKIMFLPLRKRKATNMVLLVASLGAASVIQGIVAILFGTPFYTLTQTSPKVYDVFGGAITQTQTTILFSCIVITSLLILMVNKTMFGKAVKAISDDEEVARVIGINTDKIIGYVFFIGSAVAGLGGVFVGFDTGISPTMGLLLLLKGIIAAIIGGIGNIYGALLGAFLLGFVENFGILKIAAEWKDAIAFGLLIVFLLFRPRGIIEK